METTTTNNTATAYPAPMAKTLAEILSDLRKPVPPKYISRKSTGKFSADYIHHTTVRDLLDFYAPGWWSSTKVQGIAGKIYVTVSLTIIGSDGSITREGIGNEDDVVKGYGDPSSNAAAMALRRAAMELGLGRDLWRKH